MNALPRWLLALAAALCSACSTTKLPTPQQMQSVKAIDVVLAVPGKNFAFSPSDEESALGPSVASGALGHMAGSTIATGAPAFASLGPAIGYALVANLIGSGIEFVRSATARQAAGPLGATLNDIDLRQTAFSQLQAHLPPDRAATLRLSTAPLPPLEAGLTVEQSLVKAATGQEADATLYLVVQPLFRTSSDEYPRTHAQALLVSRTGAILMLNTVQFAAPKPPDLQGDALIRWWANGRYRRFLLYSVQAVLKPIADGLAPTEAHAARTQRLRAKSQHLPSPTPANLDRRSTRCALETEPLQLVLRHEQLRSLLLIAAACEEDEEAIVRPAVDPAPDLAHETLGRGGEPAPGARKIGTSPVDTDLVWITRTSGATPAAVSRTVAR